MHSYCCTHIHTQQTKRTHTQMQHIYTKTKRETRNSHKKERNTKTYFQINKTKLDLR